MDTTLKNPDGPNQNEEYPSKKNKTTERAPTNVGKKIAPRKSPSASSCAKPVGFRVPSFTFLYSLNILKIIYLNCTIKTGIVLKNVHMETAECILLAITFLIFFYMLGRSFFSLYLKRKIKKAEINQDLKLFRDLEKEIGKNNTLYWIYPFTAHLFLSQIREKITKIHKENEEMIGIDLDFLLIQAKDEYENLNGLTTSEDNNEEHV